MRRKKSGDSFLSIISKNNARVAISLRVDYLPNRNETRDSVDQKLYSWINEQGYSPILVPNKIANLNMWLEDIRPNYIVLSGGNDIGQAHERDQTEESLLMYAKENNLPLLGICRGMQMMVILSGGTLKQVSGHVSKRHGIKSLVVDQRFPLEVNSYHNYAVEKLPPEYLVAATSEDGNIEAILHKELPWEGWMWHPERESPFGSVDSSRLRSLFNAE